MTDQDDTREKHGIRGGTASVDKVRKTLGKDDEEDEEDDE